MSTIAVTASACSLAHPAPVSQGTEPTPGVRIGRTVLLEDRPSRPRLPLHAGYPMAIVDPRPLERVLRGDFEPPDTLVLVYEDDWHESVEQIVRAAAGEARVLLLTSARRAREHAFRELAAAPHVDVWAGDFDSPWVRDYGPLQTYELAAGPLWLDFGYTWNRPQDDQFPSMLSSRLQARIESPGADLDGGAVISNGQGLCALTRTSLLDAGFEDPAWGELERFMGSLGCHATAVLPVVPGEPTGHADVVAQFLAHDLVMVAWVDAEAHPELSPALDAVADALQATAEFAEYPLDVVRIPIQTSGETFFSYVNATRLHHRLLVPRFNELPEQLEQSGYALLARALPDVSIVPIDADVMVRLGGAVHCITLGLGPTEAPPVPVQRADLIPPAPTLPSMIPGPT